MAAAEQVIESFNLRFPDTFPSTAKEASQSGRTEIFNSGHGDWNCEFSEGFLNGKKRKLIKIPHLSRYKINAHNDVINWIKSVGDIKR